MQAGGSAFAVVVILTSVAVGATAGATAPVDGLGAGDIHPAPGEASECPFGAEAVLLARQTSPGQWAFKLARGCLDAFVFASAGPVGAAARVSLLPPDAGTTVEDVDCDCLGVGEHEDLLVDRSFINGSWDPATGGCIEADGSSQAELCLTDPTAAPAAGTIYQASLTLREHVTPVLDGTPGWTTYVGEIQMVFVEARGTAQELLPVDTR